MKLLDLRADGDQVAVTVENAPQVLGRCWAARESSTGWSI